MKNIKDLFDDERFLRGFYETAVAVIYLVLILLSAVFAFYNFVTDAGWGGIYWAATCLYWIINFAGRSVRREINDPSDDDFGGFDEDGVPKE